MILVDTALEEKVLYYAKELVRVKSLSGREENVAYLIKEFLSREGVDKVFIDSYGNVISIIKGGVEKTIVFEGHMDHVPEGERSNWIVDPYEARVIDGKLYGRGAVDMKGAIASMIAMAGLVGETKDKPTIVYLFVPHEEIVEGALFKYALEDTLGIVPSLVVLGEATNLNLHIGQRGRTVIYVEVHGVSAHASMPDKGVNPILFVAKLVEEIDNLGKRLPRHKLLGRSTIVPTILECSPKSPPMIPDYCRLVIDRRFIVGESKEAIVNEVNGLAKKVFEKQSVREFSVYIPVEDIVLWSGRRISVQLFFPAWILEDMKLANNLLKILRKTNPYAEISVWRFSTDGVYSAGVRGIKTVGVGPGDEALAHKPNEYVEVKQLVKASKIYHDIVANATNYI